MNLVLLGPPGAGKGTQAKVLSSDLKIPHVSTGDMLRNAVNKNSDLGKKAKNYMLKGELVPDELVTAIVRETLASEEAKNGFILDGFPRTVEQAKSLDEAMGGIGKKLDLAIYFKTSIEISVARLGGRRVCKKCGANFHKKNIPPKKEDVCDYCGGALYQRKDDEAETVKRRWSVYHKETSPVIDYYLGKGVLREVSGDLDAEGLNKILKDIFQKENLL